MATIEEVLTSWGAVYAAIFLPALLMLVNFVFGKCFVSEALSRAQHAPQSTHTRSRIVGRTHVALVALSFVWQYYVVMFVARTKVGGNPDAHACNPLYSVWDVVDALPWLHDVQVRLWFHCTASDVLYLSLVTAFAYFYVACVFSVPQIRRGTGEKAGGCSLIEADLSHCRRCDADVYRMDHHCYFICNCVAADNRRTFWWCLGSGIANLSYLLYYHLIWVLLEGDAATNVGALLVVVFDLFLMGLLSFQVLLWRRGWSTREFLKVRRCDHEPLWRSLKRLLMR